MIEFEFFFFSQTFVLLRELRQLSAPPGLQPLRQRRRLTRPRPARIRFPSCKAHVVILAVSLRMVVVLGRDWWRGPVCGEGLWVKVPPLRVAVGGCADRVSAPPCISRYAGITIDLVAAAGA